MTYRVERRRNPGPPTGPRHVQLDAQRHRSRPEAERTPSYGHTPSSVEEKRVQRHLRLLGRLELIAFYFLLGVAIAIFVTWALVDLGL